MLERVRILLAIALALVSAPAAAGACPVVDPTSELIGETNLLVAIPDPLPVAASNDAELAA